MSDQWEMTVRQGDDGKWDVFWGDDGKWDVFWGEGWKFSEGLGLETEAEANAWLAGWNKGYDDACEVRS